MNAPDPAATAPSRRDLRVSTNQAPLLAGHNVVTADRALSEAVVRHAGPAVLDDVTPLGFEAGSAEAREQGLLANEHHPELTPYDRYGNRVDEVRFHPSWHWLMERSIGHGLAATPWERADDGDTHAHVRRAAGFMAWGHTEPGHGCPVSMTYAAVPALRADDALAKEWTPLLASTTYDPGLRAPATKLGALAGMGMTEKQGGSDVRANVTVARPTSVDGEYTLHGHKWFTSAPMNDVFLVLAQTAGGVTCFVVPRVLPDGTRNQLDVVRLKDKLGNRSNASSELEFDGTLAHRLGDEGRGVRTIIEMVAATRLDCVLGSAALMRKAVSEASWHVAHRSAFGGVLADKPLMQNVIADLAVESEAATALAIRLAAAVDGLGTGHEAALRRIALPLAKFWVCKRTPAMVAEALECLGGNGYVEESGMPLLYREAPLNSVWEGSGNVNALDVLRALGREPEVLDAWITEVGLAQGADARLDAAIHSTLAMLGDGAALEVNARRLAVRMALCLQGSLLVRFAPAEVADVFCASRLGTSYDGVFGTLASGDLAAIVERTTPVVWDVASVLSVNIGGSEPNPAKEVGVTGFGKRPVDSASLRQPGPKHGGLGSGLVGDFIGETASHGGDRQAVYAVAREELDAWGERLERRLEDGAFGENLTTLGLDVDGSRVGDRWSVGDEVVLEVTGPRIPCVTFAARMGVRGWLRMFTQRGRTGAYLSIVTGGTVRPGDQVSVLSRAEHDILLPQTFAAFMGDVDAARAVLAAGILPDDEADWLRGRVAARDG